MDLLKIAMCDDEEHWHANAKKIVESYASSAGFAVELISFYNKSQLVAYNGDPLDAVFMDVELEDENGIEVASAVNKKWPACAVVYVTNYLFYATDSYDTEHVYFVLKERFEEKIAVVFEKVFKRRGTHTTKLVFELIGEQNRKISVFAGDIRYFERDKRKTKIYTCYGVYEVWDKIGDIEKRLPTPDFVRCHNSFIVYFPAIRELSSDSLIMNDGTSVPISRSYSKRTRELFTAWASSFVI